MQYLLENCLDNKSENVGTSQKISSLWPTLKPTNVIFEIDVQTCKNFHETQAFVPILACCVVDQIVEKAAKSAT